MPPEVTAIIPSIGRSSLVDCVQSCLQQTVSVDVIVVVDQAGKLASVAQMLAGLSCRILEGAGDGPAAARNLGVRNANTQFVAFLDDDDTWMPMKTELQLASIRAFGGESKSYSVGLSSFIGERLNFFRKPMGVFSLEVSTLANYLVARKSVLFGSIYFQSSLLMMERSLALKHPWPEKFRKFEDWGYFIELTDINGFAPIQIHSPIATIKQGSWGSGSKESDSQVAFDWLEKYDEQLSGSARADFALLHIFVPQLKNHGLKAAINLMRKCKLRKFPHAAALVRALALCFGQ